MTQTKHLKGVLQVELSWMKKGKILQNGSPIEIYQLPKTLWASSFVGEANHLSAEWKDNSLNSALWYKLEILGAE